MAYEFDPVLVEKAKKYIDLALEMGATDAVLFEAPQICWDSRTLLKCMYGCDDWGKNHTCPSRPGNPSMAEMKGALSLKDRRPTKIAWEYWSFTPVARAIRVNSSNARSRWERPSSWG